MKKLAVLEMAAIEGGGWWQNWGRCLFGTVGGILLGGLAGGALGLVLVGVVGGGLSGAAAGCD